MAKKESKAFLGSGIAFPFHVDESTGKIAMVSYEDDIKQSVELILYTYEGERVMRPTFGTHLEDYIFDENTKTTAFNLQNEVHEALVKWEPRIINITVDAQVNESDNVILVDISYVVRSTNNMFNVVYPFYLLEGTGTEEFE